MRGEYQAVERPLSFMGRVRNVGRYVVGVPLGIAMAGAILLIRGYKSFRRDEEPGECDSFGDCQRD